MASLMEWKNCVENKHQLEKAEYILTMLHTLQSSNILYDILSESLFNYHTIIMKHGNDDLKKMLCDWNDDCDYEWDDTIKLFISKE